jgi:hypothetical protein
MFVNTAFLLLFNDYVSNLFNKYFEKRKCVAFQII